MSYQPKKFNSEIIIDSSGRWFFRGNEIIQEKVLSYFKQNLKEDGDGIYIENHYGKFVEHGYIESNYYPLKLIEYDYSHEGLFFLSENERVFSINNLDFFINEEGNLLSKAQEANYILHNFSLKVLSFLAEFLEGSEQEGFYLQCNGIKKDIFRYTKNISVVVPSKYSKILNNN